MIDAALWIEILHLFEFNMARGSNLIPFLKEGLARNLYATLSYTDKSCSTARVKLPRASDRLNRLDQKLVKDWDVLKGRSYYGTSSYSKARQRFRQAIKKNPFLEKLSVSNYVIEFRFITATEISENNLLQDDASSESVPSPVESFSSGYYSGPEMIDDDPEFIPNSEISESTHHDPLLDSPGEVMVEVPENIFADSENESTQPSADVSSWCGENQHLIESCYFCSTVIELHNKYVVNCPSSSQEAVHDIKQGLSEEPSFMVCSGANDEFALVPSMDFESFAAFEQEEFKVIDFSTLNDSTPLRNADVMVQEPPRAVSAGEVQEPPGAVSAGEVQEPPGAVSAGEVQEPPGAVTAGGVCRAWVCTEVLQLDSLRQLIFEEKVFQVNSPPYGKLFTWNSGMINIILDQKIIEDMKAYELLEVQFIGKHMFIFYKPKF